jgi:hypothetical protein
VFLLFLQSAGPITGCTAAILQYIDTTGELEKAVAWLAPAAFFFHMLTITYLVVIGSERNGDLPTKYATVVSIDVLGLWNEDKTLEDVDEEGEDQLLTGWQKKFLKATKREAPVSALIPQSVDLSQAEELRKSKPKRIDKSKSLNRLRASALLSGDDLGGEEQAARPSQPTQHNKTLAWFAFRQAGGLVVLIWLVAICAGIVVAVHGDIPGWDSDPASHTTASGVALWTPLAKNFANNNFHPLLSDSNHDSLVQMVRAVTPEGVHVLVGDRAQPYEYRRSVLWENEENQVILKDYSEFGGWGNFSTITSATIKDITQFPSGRVPWCSQHDVVTMVEDGVFRDCSSLGVIWHLADHPDSHFAAVTGKFGLNVVDRNIYRFQFFRTSLTLRAETRIQVPVSLETVVDLAKNEFLMACITKDGLLGVWTTLHEEVPSKGVRELPNRHLVEWRTIVGAGGKAFIVFGEVKATAKTQAFFINDILLLNRFGHHHHNR